MTRMIWCVLLFCLALGAAEAKEPPGVGDIVVEGQTPGDRMKLSEWIPILDDKSSRSLDARRALVERGRFLVGAHELVVPALLERAKKKQVSMIENLGWYGALAAGALDYLRSLKDDPVRASDALAARILIGDDRAANLEAFLKELKLRAKKQGESKAAEWDYRDMVELGMQLGPYGDAGVVKQLRRAFPLKGRMMLAVMELEFLGPSGTPLVRELDDLLDAKDLAVRSRAMLVVASADKLNGTILRRLLDGASFSAERLEAKITKRIAIYRNERKPRLLRFLRAKTKKEDGHRKYEEAHAWAFAGIARLSPEDTQARQALLERLDHEIHGIRTAAAHGLMYAGVPDADLVKRLVPRLADVDLRVRWRAAAMLLAAGEHVERALPELARGIDGPCDWDRLLAFEAIERIGSAAAPLRTKLEPWAASPSRRLAKAAKKALSAAR